MEKLDQKRLNANAYKGYALLQVTKEKSKLPSITIPGMAIDIETSVRRYTSQSMEDKIATYYEEQGMEMPNWARLDKLERLHLIANTKEKVDQKLKDIDTFAKEQIKANRKADAEKKAKEANIKQGESKNKEQ